MNRPAGFAPFQDLQERIDNINRSMRAGMGLPPFEKVTTDMGWLYIFGYGDNGLPFVFQSIEQPVLIIGVQKSGKTTGIANFIKSNSDKIKFIIIESFKHDYRHLDRYLPNVRVFSYQLKTARDNFLQAPPGMAGHEWNSVFADIFTESLKLVIGAGVYHYFYNAISELKRIVHPRIPALRDLYEYIKAKNEMRYSENFTFRERILNRLAAIVEDLGETINCSEGYPIDQMQEQNTVDIYELSNKTDTASLTFDLIIQKNLRYRMSLTPEQRRKPLVFVIDEAKRMFGQHKINSRYTGNMDSFSNSLSISREYNVSYIILDQSLSSLHPNAPDFCGTFCLFQSNAETIHKMSNIMGLNQEQRAWLMEHGLETGQCVVKSGNWPPVIVRIPHFIYEKNVTDEEIRI
jgi:hypothetical protein